MAAGFDAYGSLLTGLATGAVGLTFLCLGLLAGQIVQTARSANAVGVALVLGAYLLRAIGDAAGTADLGAAHGDQRLADVAVPERLGSARQSLLGAPHLALRHAHRLCGTGDRSRDHHPSQAGFRNQPAARSRGPQRSASLPQVTCRVALPTAARLSGGLDDRRRALRLLAGTLSETVGTIVSGDENVRRIMEALAPGGTTKIICAS
jgi:hypothetical protein